MKRPIALVALGIMCSFAGPSYASIDYEFSAEVGTVNDDDLALVISLGTPVTGSFTYDPTISPGTDFPIAGFGPGKRYDGALTSLSVTLDGNVLAVDSATVFVLDADSAMQPTLLDGLFLNARSDESLGWNGFELGGQVLAGFNIFTIGNSSLLSSVTLPADPVPVLTDPATPGVTTRHMSLRFVPAGTDPLPNPLPQSLILTNLTITRSAEQLTLPNSLLKLIILLKERGEI